MDEVEKLIPHKIDRGEPLDTPAGHMMPTSFPIQGSTDDIIKRKKAAIEYLGINRTSSYIPIMIGAVNSHIGSLKVGQEVNFSTLAKHISFEILSKQLLGKDYNEIKMDFDYLCSDTKSIIKMSFPSFFMKLLDDELDAYTSPVSKLLKFLADSHLIEPYKTNYRNNLYLRKRLQELLEASTDTESMYYGLKNLNNVSIEDCIMDLLSLIFAGFDTTSRAICTSLYYLKKHPKVHDKLMDEIRKHKLDQIEKVPFEKLRDTFQNCDYLMYVVKEGLRINTPIPTTLVYVASEELKV